MTTTTALKRYVSVISGQSPASDDVSDYEGTGLPFLQGNAEFGFINPRPILRCDSTTRQCRAGDILISVRAPVGALNVADRSYGIGRGLCAIRSRDIHPRFLWWLLHACLEQLFSLATGSTYDAVTAEDVQSLRVTVPDFDQQRAIADYLDAETARIDALVNAGHQRMTLAEERLVAAIQCLVLGREDKAVRLNDSIEVVLPIPPQWSFRRNKTFLREVVELSPTGDEELLTVSHLTGVTPRSEKQVTMFLAESNEGYKRVRAGDLVVNTMWAWMGALGVARQHGIVSPAYGVYRFTDPAAVPDYFDALFRSPAYVTEMTRRSKGVWTSRLRLYPEAFLAMSSPFPSQSAQHRIAVEVERWTLETRRLVTCLQNSQSLLAERRQALITAAISGELDIPGVAA